MEKGVLSVLICRNNFPVVWRGEGFVLSLQRETRGALLRAVLRYAIVITMSDTE